MILDSMIRTSYPRSDYSVSNMASSTSTSRRKQEKPQHLVSTESLTSEEPFLTIAEDPKEAVESSPENGRFFISKTTTVAKVILIGNCKRANKISIIRDDCRILHSTESIAGWKRDGELKTMLFI